MKFENNGVAISAAWAWHEAFNTGVTSIDYREVLNTFGVQFTAKGGDGKVMDHCEKGIIQQVIAKIRVENPIAWAWGMHAYAPVGTVNANTLRNTLFEYAMKSITTNNFNAFISMEAGKLAFVAIQDAKVESITGERRRRKRTDMATLLRVNEMQYLKVWRPRLFTMKDALKDLSVQALPPVANVVWAVVEHRAEEIDRLLTMPVNA